MSSFDRAIQPALRLTLFLLGMICLCLVAFQPFTQGQLPYSADGMLQLYRTTALDHSLRVDAAIWPRFSSGLVYGYGAPLFNFFPPLSYYPAVLTHNLGLSFLDSWLLVICLYTVAAAIGMFLLARLWTRSGLGGWIAAAAYIYSPYWLFDGVARGASAELAALAALPYACYGLTRLAHYGRRQDFALALLALALFMPLHTIITLHGSALLTVYCIFLIWQAHNRRDTCLRLLLAGVLALLLTAFYWLPALLESDAIKLGLISQQLSHIDIERHLRSLDEVLALPRAADPTQQNFAVPITLSWLQLIVSAAGLLLTWRPARRRCRPLLLSLWALLVFLVFLNTPASAPLWQGIPLINLTQFPWRALGLASLLLALMTALSLHLLLLHVRAARLGPGLACGFLLATMLYASPWTYSLLHADITLEDIRDVQAFERESGQLALSSYAEYLPISADAAQLDPGALGARFAIGYVIPRLSESESLAILNADWRGASARLRVESRRAQSLSFDWLYFPGWSATIDGTPAAVFPSIPTGLVAITVPAGQFDLHIELAPTTIQTIAIALSLLGLIAALAALASKSLFSPSRQTAAPTTDGQWLRLVAVTGIAAFLFKAAVLDGGNTLFKSVRFAPETEAPALANFGDKIDLLAVENPDSVIDQPELTVRLFWRLRDLPLERDYSSILRLRNPAGFVIAESAAFAPGGLASSNWLPDAYIEDEILLRLPPFTPNLDAPYTLEVGLYDSITLRALSLMNAAGNPQDVKFIIASPRLQLSASAFQGQNIRPLAAPADAAGVALLAAPQLPAEALAGAVLPLNWTWQKTDDSNRNVQAQLLWLAEDDALVDRSAAGPLVAGYDTADWRRGEVNRGHFALIVPPSLPGGRYNLALELLDARGQPLGPNLPLDQQLDVVAPQRQFDAPDFALPAAADWDNGISLLGYSLDSQGSLSLVWRAHKLLAVSLHLFVHILDAQERIIAQWDGMPVEWTRPTTSWLPGEYLTTRHAFDLPPGQYQLAVGWYAPATGERVSIGALDAFQLPSSLAID